MTHTHHPRFHFAPLPSMVSRMSNRDSLLFIDKVFFKRCKDASHLRGVELFNLHLINDLVAADYDITVLAQPSWHGPIDQIVSTGPLTLVHPPEWGIPVVHGLCGAIQLGRRHFRTLLVGNAGNGVMPTIRLLHARRTFERCITIAHREPSRAFARLCSRLPGTVLAVNRPIADHFVRAGGRDVHVDYGILNADRFYPTRAERPAEPVRFCVLGVLENPWKGADTAVTAFRRLPPALQARTELHLASYEAPPDFAHESIKSYAWMPATSIPDFLRNMDVLIVPSRDEEVMRETFSQATVQGMLTGLPVLYSDLPVLNEKFDQGGGIRFTDADSLTNAMTTLIESPAERRQLGQQARAIALERYVWSTGRFIDRYLRTAEVKTVRT